MSQKTQIAQGAEAIITLVTNKSPSKKNLSLNKSPAKRLDKVSRVATNRASAPIVLKNRIKKSYRIPELDIKIRNRRTKAETKLLKKASEIINCPIPEISKDKTKIKMPFIDGKKLSIYLDKFPLTKQKLILKQIGKDISKLHKENIIHGDLTTSNMIYVLKNNFTKISHTKTPNSKVHLLLNNPSAKKSGEADFIAINSRAKSEPIIFLIDFGLGYFNGKIEDKAVDIHLLKQALEAKHFKNWKILFQEFKKGYISINKTESKKVLERLIAVEKRGRYKK